MSMYIIAPSANKDLNQIADYFLVRNLVVRVKSSDGLLNPRLRRSCRGFGPL
jgi:plasmid stabilization system protein ParE